MIRLKAEVRGSDALDALALGIFRQALGRHLAQPLEHPGRGRKCVLVEVQAQGIAACQRRVILRHGQHGATWHNIRTNFRRDRIICNYFGSRCHRILTRTLCAWPIRPSASASEIA